VPLPMFVLFIIILLTAVWASLQRAFERSMKVRHPGEYKALGAPENIFDHSTMDVLRRLGFVFTRRYRTLNDRKLTRVCNALFVVIILLACAWIVAFVAPRGVFVRLPF